MTGRSGSVGECEGAASRVLAAEIPSVRDSFLGIGVLTGQTGVVEDTDGEVIRLAC